MAEGGRFSTRGRSPLSRGRGLCGVPVRAAVECVRAIAAFNRAGFPCAWLRAGAMPPALSCLGGGRRRGRAGALSHERAGCSGWMDRLARFQTAGARPIAQHGWFGVWWGSGGGSRRGRAGVCPARSSRECLHSSMVAASIRAGRPRSPRRARAHPCSAGREVTSSPSGRECRSPAASTGCPRPRRHHGIDRRHGRQTQYDQLRGRSLNQKARL